MGGRVEGKGIERRNAARCGVGRGEQRQGAGRGEPSRGRVQCGRGDAGERAGKVRGGWGNWRIRSSRLPVTQRESLTFHCQGGFMERMPCASISIESRIHFKIESNVVNLSCYQMDFCQPNASLGLSTELS